MRSAQQVLFPWAYQDRVEDVPRFRQMARRWRPVVRPAVDEDDVDGLMGMANGSLQRGPLPRPTWSPWLWVK
jgi:hypothetical protein